MLQEGTPLGPTRGSAPPRSPALAPTRPPPRHRLAVFVLTGTPAPRTPRYAGQAPTRRHARRSPRAPIPTRLAPIPGVQPDSGRAWSKAPSGGAAKKRKALAMKVAEPVVLDELDDLPSGMQLAAMTTLDRQEERVRARPKLALVGVGSGKTGQTAPNLDSDDEPALMPMTSRETLARMYKNMLDSGLTLDDLAGF